MRPRPTDPSASYALEVARLLWPAPWETPYLTRTRRRTGETHRDAYVFPSRSRPRLLVPVDVPGSASMLARLGTGRRPGAGPARRLLERSVRSRAFPLARWPILRVEGAAPGADSIEEHLSACFDAPVRVGVLLGTRRVNQKPVLQVFGRDGGLLGFAKIGHNELTSALVRREAAALTELHVLAPRDLVVPQLLHHQRWSGLEVLVMTALVTDPRGRVGPAARAAAMREVMCLGGTVEAPLAGSGFWARLVAATERLRDAPHGRHLGSAVCGIEAAHAAEPLVLGGWHGDWGHWNMGVGATDHRLQVWDWERYDAQVPLGFDGLHFAAQAVRPGERDETGQERDFLGSVPSVLDALGVPPHRHDLSLRLYLLEIATRYVDALTHGATPALHRRTSWVLSLLDRLPAPTARPDRTTSPGGRA